MITMLLGGLWHGASWNFVLWGGLHGAALVVERVFGLGGKPGSRLCAAVAWVVTFHFVCLTWVFFRSPSNEATLAYFTTLFAGASWSTTMTPLVASVLVLGALTQVIPARWSDALEKRYDAGSLAFKVAVPFAVIFLISVAAPAGMAPFIYFQF